MSACYLLETLHQHQAKVYELLDDVHGLLEEPTDTRIRKLILLRWEINQVLQAYQRFKHGEIFDPMMLRDDLTISSLARDMKDRCLLVGRTHDDYVRRWSAAEMATNWPLYRLEALGFMATREAPSDL